MTDLTNTPETGGAAFPTLDHNGHSLVCREFGMTLRDWFAGQALAGFAAGYFSNDSLSGLGPNELADAAYGQADAMIAARKGGAA